MKRIFASLFIAAVLVLARASVADAALLTFTKGGEIYWNVLATTDDQGRALEITQIANNPPKSSSSAVALSNSNGKTTLSYDDSTIDVTGYENEIIEIEEKNAPTKIAITATASGFAISQKGMTAQTSFPIRINSPKNQLSVETPSGYRFLTVLPFDAVNQIIRSKIISKVTNGNSVNLIETEEDLAYEVVGEKSITLFKLFQFEVPIKVNISAISGDVVNVDQPLWYSLVGFLLV